MNSWVYFFSKFTSEALVFELLLIFSLLASYTAFWVLKKRRLGATREYVPAGVFKQYLNELIGEAHLLRNQLFGILGDMGVPTAGGPTLAANVEALAAKIASAPTAAPTDTKGLEEIQAKLAAQMLAYQNLETEKKKLEEQLATAKAAGGGGNPAETKALQDKVKDLEGKLGEYAIIEDDLAQLKRLQQENEQLRNALAGKGPAPTATISAAAGATAAAAAAAVAAATTPTPAPVPEATPAAPEVAAAPTPEVPATTDAPAFENLVDQVESSLVAPAAAPAAAPETAPAAAKTDSVAAIVKETAAPAAPAPEQAAAPTAEAASSASDQDLLSEFEKMLNG